MRSPQFERQFVDEAARLAGHGFNGYQARVTERLAVGARLYRDQAIRTPLSQLAGELAEEGRDLATWAVLAAQCDELASADPERRDAIMRQLLRIASLGALVEHEVARLREAIG